MSTRRGWGLLTPTLVLLLAVLSGYVVVGARRQAELVQVVADAGTDTDAYQNASYLVTSEMALIQAAMREPEGEERLRVVAVNDQADAAMAHMAEVDSEHRESASYIALQHHKLQATLLTFLAELDRREMSAAFETLETLIEPEYEAMTDQLLAEQKQHLAEYDHLQATARHDSGRALLISFIAFLLGLVVLAALMLSGRAQRRKIESMAATDALTGLPNRAAFTARTEAALTGRPGVAVLVVDVDGFRDVNDQLGQRIGDLLLIEIGHRLRSTVRSGDLVARLGGDEFAILLNDAETGAAIAARLIEQFDRSFVLDDVTVDLEVSIGAAIAADGEQASVVLRHADTAMHDAKLNHAGFHAYRDEARQDVAARLKLLGDLRRALDDRGQLTLYYQPKVALDGGALVGVEALARWQHPVRGPISPAEFIPVLEVTSLMHRFTEQMLAEALRQARTWVDAGHRVPIAVNVSTRSLLEPGFPDRVAAMLAESGLPGAMLCVEVTEYALMSDPDTAIAALRQLRELGVKASIDDYGTGYSSMTYLKVLPVAELKIDQSFVRDIVGDAGSRALVASTVELGHSLGLTVVAEGVEDEATLSALRAVGCDTAQGYHIAKPMPADALTAGLENKLLTVS
jgi:diguanylate cyclase (GGDEF)-like protein